MTSPFESRLTQIQDRVDAATEGPWEERDEEGEWYFRPPSTGSFLINDGRSSEQKFSDARFIAAARSDIPWLLDQLSRYHAAIQAVREITEGIEGWPYTRINRAIATELEKP